MSDTDTTRDRPASRFRPGQRFHFAGTEAPDLDGPYASFIPRLVCGPLERSGPDGPGPYWNYRRPGVMTFAPLYVRESDIVPLD